MGLPDSNPQFPALTGVRALAVYLVYLHHINPFSGENSWHFLRQLITEFHVGVSLFFVLSGFLITYRYWDFASLNKKWFKPYLVNRVARVYPMYFIITTVTLVVFVLQGRLTDQIGYTYFMNITFLRGFFDKLKFTLVGPGWSLTVEECFYFSAPLLFLVLRKNRRFLFLLPLLLLATGYLLVILSGGKTRDGFFDSAGFFLIYTFPGRCVEFFWGIGLALLLKKHSPAARQGAWITSTGLLLMSALVTSMALLGEGGVSSIYGWRGLVLNNFLLPGAIAVFFYGLICESGGVRNILASAPAVMLGKSSYTFYLIHTGIIYHFLENAKWPAVMIFLALNAGALFLWHFVEEPLNKAIRRYA